jgi:hypothetical protein
MGEFVIGISLMLFVAFIIFCVVEDRIVKAKRKLLVLVSRVEKNVKSIAGDLLEESYEEQFQEIEADLSAVKNLLK